MRREAHPDPVAPGLFMVTLLTRDRERVLVGQVAELVLSQLVKQRDRFAIEAFVMFGDRLHLLVRAEGRPRLTALKRNLQRPVDRHRRQLRIMALAPLWDPGVYVHYVPPEDVSFALDDLHQEPVRRGLVGRPGDYVYSSLRWPSS